MNVNGNANLDIYFDSDRPAVRSARATVTALAAAVPLAVAFALTAPAARSVLGQAPTPQPQTTSPPTPVPTPVPGPGRTARPPGFALLGALPECNFHASLSASQDAVIAGEPVTLTVSTAIDCPQQLDRRAAVVIIGSRTHASIRDARASLTLLVEHMATGRGTRLAIVEVGAATGPAPWASTPAEIAALDGRVRQLEVQTVLDETAWVDAIEHTTTPDAPWYVIPANRKWYRDLVCVATIVEALERLDMRFPPAEDGVEGVVIE